MSLVWEHYPTGGGELLSALAYADHAHDDGTGIRPSVAYMARKTRQSERTIQMHLSAMKRMGWLLTVRYATGGAGRVTEYRVNPAWISNPAEFAPFPETSKRVQQGAEKGAIDSKKGCKAFAPQPSRTISEPTTTRNQGNDCNLVSLDELKWPALRADAAYASAVKILQDCPDVDRQNVLDEIGGLADKNEVRRPIGLLRKLVQRAKQGLFVPAAALDYQRVRESQAIAAQTRIAVEQQRKQQPPPATREVTQARLALLHQQLTGQLSLIDVKESP